MNILQSHFKNMETYTGPYKVVKIFRISRRKQVLERNLTREEAIRLVNSYPDSNRSMVVLYKQYTSAQYFI
jgi:hypothetical protein